MEQLAGGVAVVTGAASGIGRAMAERFAAEGMRVAMADVEAGALDEAAGALAGEGHEVLAVVTDVSDRASVDALAAEVIGRWGPPNVVCNNAGVSGGGAGGGGGGIWTTTANDWSWVLGVNLMGVVHGIQAFVPAMVESGAEGHVVNTSSVLGLGTGGGSIYSVTKHAVTRLSEGLWYDLRAAGAPIGVSVLCPGLIATRIVTSARNRPQHLRDRSGDDAADEAAAAQAAARMEAVQAHFLSEGMPPAEVAGMVVDAVKNGTFYVLTHPEMIRKQVEDRFRAILDGTDPPPVRSPLLGGSR